MAAITTIVTGNQATKRVRTASAQATTGQTDYVAVPDWAQYAKVYFNITTITATSSGLAIKDVVPFTLDSTYQMNLAEHAAFTVQTAASLLVVDIGPGVTGIADDTTNSATANSYVKLNTVLPVILGLVVTTVVGGGAVTYTLDVHFRGRK